MYRGNSKIIPIIVLVIVVIVAIIALVSVGKSLLSRSTQPAVVEDVAQTALLNTEIDRSVRMSVRGPIVADEEFRSYDIEISPVSRRLTVYKGYDRQSIEDIRLGNNTEAYAQLVNALNLASFTRTAPSAVGVNDIQGICASGRVYTFSLLQAQSATKQLWAASCRGVDGSFRGSATQVRDLFQSQIPDSSRLLRNIDM